MKANQPSWTALLNGSQAATAMKTVDDLAHDLARLSPAQIGPSLAKGCAGLALFFDALHRLRGDTKSKEQALFFLQESIVQATTSPLGPGLYFGLSGVAFAAQLLGCGDAIDASIDDELLAIVQQDPWRWDHDLLSGLVGIGVYAHSRLPFAVAREILEAVVQRLQQLTRRSPRSRHSFHPTADAGIALIHTPRELLLGRTDDANPCGHFNLGMAHGQPALIAFLGLAQQAGVEGALPLLRDVVHGLLQLADGLVRSEDPSQLEWPAWLDDDGTLAPPARLAWCYGNPGIALGLLVAARCSADRNLEALATATLQVALKRPPTQSGVIDAGLCHGALGLGHLYNRFYQASSRDDAYVFADAAKTWIDVGIAMRRSDRGIAGFVAHDLSSDGRLGWIDAPGLLNGAAGIGLALCSALSNEALQWDRAMLLHLPT